jgi:broad specificity phosphatase PhoE
LRELGERQARALGERFATIRIDALYSSPLARARTTADAVASVTNLDVFEDARLQEYDFGEVSGLTWREIRDQHPEIARAYREEPGFPEFPGDEGRESFAARVSAAFSEIVGKHKEDDAVAVVTHGGPILIHVMASLGYQYTRPSRFRVDNTSVATIEYNARPGPSVPACTVVGLNDTCHLRSLVK